MFIKIKEFDNWTLQQLYSRLSKCTVMLSDIEEKEYVIPIGRPLDKDGVDRYYHGDGVGAFKSLGGDLAYYSAANGPIIYGEYYETGENYQVTKKDLKYIVSYINALSKAIKRREKVRNR